MRSVLKLGERGDGWGGEALGKGRREEEDRGYIEEEDISAAVGWGR